MKADQQFGNQDEFIQDQSKKRDSQLFMNELNKSSNLQETEIQNISQKYQEALNQNNNNNNLIQTYEITQQKSVTEVKILDFKTASQPIISPKQQNQIKQQFNKTFQEHDKKWIDNPSQLYQLNDFSPVSQQTNSQLQKRRVSQLILRETQNAFENEKDQIDSNRNNNDFLFRQAQEIYNQKQERYQEKRSNKSQIYTQQYQHNNKKYSSQVDISNHQYQFSNTQIQQINQKQSGHLITRELSRIYMSKHSLNSQPDLGLGPNIQATPQSIPNKDLLQKKKQTYSQLNSKNMNQILQNDEPIVEKKDIQNFEDKNQLHSFRSQLVRMQDNQNEMTPIRNNSKLNTGNNTANAKFSDTPLNGFQLTPKEKVQFSTNDKQDLIEQKKQKTKNKFRTSKEYSQQTTVQINQNYQDVKLSNYTFQSQDIDQKKSHLDTVTEQVKQSYHIQDIYEDGKQHHHQRKQQQDENDEEKVSRIQEHTDDEGSESDVTQVNIINNLNSSQIQQQLHELKYQKEKNELQNLNEQSDKQIIQENSQIKDQQYSSNPNISQKQNKNDDDDPYLYYVEDDKYKKQQLNESSQNERSEMGSQYENSEKDQSQEDNNSSHDLDQNQEEFMNQDDLDLIQKVAKDYIAFLFSQHEALKEENKSETSSEQQSNGNKEEEIDSEEYQQNLQLARDYITELFIKFEQNEHQLQNNEQFEISQNSSNKSISEQSQINNKDISNQLKQQNEDQNSPIIKEEQEYQSQNNQLNESNQQDEEYNKISASTIKSNQQNQDVNMNADNEVRVSKQSDNSLSQHISRLQTNQPENLRNQGTQKEDEQQNNQYVTVQDIHKQLTVDGSFAIPQTTQSNQKESKVMSDNILVAGNLNKNSTTDVINLQSMSSPLPAEKSNLYSINPVEIAQIQETPKILLRDEPNLLNKMESLNQSQASYQQDPNVNQTQINHLILSPVQKLRQNQVQSFQKSDSQPINLPTQQSQQYEIIQTFRNSQLSEALPHHSNNHSSGIQEINHIPYLHTNQNEVVSTQQIISTYRSGTQKRQQSLQNSTDENQLNIETIIQKYNQLEEDENKLRDKLLKDGNLKEQSKEIELINQILRETPIDTDIRFQNQQQDQSSSRVEISQAQAEVMNKIVGKGEAKISLFDNDQDLRIQSKRESLEQNQHFDRNINKKDNSKIKSRDGQNVDKQDSVITVEENFNLQEFLRKQNNQKPQFAQNGLINPNAQYKPQDIKEFQKNTSVSHGKNRPIINQRFDIKVDYIIKWDPSLYKEMQQKAKNKRIADYFQNPLVVLNQTLQRGQVYSQNNSPQKMQPKLRYQDQVQSQSPNQLHKKAKIFSQPTSNGMQSYRKQSLQNNKYFHIRHQSQNQQQNQPQGSSITFKNSHIFRKKQQPNDSFSMVFNNISQLSEYSPIFSNPSIQQQPSLSNGNRSTKSPLKNQWANNQQVNFYPQNFQPYTSNYPGNSGGSLNSSMKSSNLKGNNQFYQSHYSHNQPYTPFSQSLNNSGIIDLNSTYNLVESIRQQYSEEKKKVNNGGNLYEDQQNIEQNDKEQQLDERQKWDEVRRFMSKNPNVLMQILQIQDDQQPYQQQANNFTQNKQIQEIEGVKQEFFNRRKSNNRVHKNEQNIAVEEQQIGSNFSSQRQYNEENLEEQRQLPNITLNNYLQSQKLNNGQKPTKRILVSQQKQSQLPQSINHQQNVDNKSYQDKNSIQSPSNLYSHPNFQNDLAYQVAPSLNIEQNQPPFSIHRKIKSSVIDDRRTLPNYLHQYQQRQLQNFRMQQQQFQQNSNQNQTQFYPNTYQQRKIRRINQQQQQQVVIYNQSPRAQKDQRSQSKSKSEAKSNSNLHHNNNIQNYQYDNQKLQQYLIGPDNNNQQSPSNTDYVRSSQNSPKNNVETHQLNIKDDLPLRIGLQKQDNLQQAQVVPKLKIDLVQPTITTSNNDHQIQDDNILQTTNLKPPKADQSINMSRLSEESEQIHKEMELLHSQRQQLSEQQAQIEKEKQELMQKLEEMEIKKKLQEERQKLEQDRQILEDERKNLEMEKQQVEKLKLLIKQKHDTESYKNNKLEIVNEELIENQTNQSQIENMVKEQEILQQNTGQNQSQNLLTLITEDTSAVKHKELDGHKQSSNLLDISMNQSQMPQISPRTKPLESDLKKILRNQKQFLQVLYYNKQHISILEQMIKQIQFL